MKAYHYKFMPDRLQFYLLEEGAFGGVYEPWTQEEAARNLWLRDGAIGVWTYPDMTVTTHLTIEIRDSEPALEEGDWPRINECSLKASSGWLGLSYWGYPGVIGRREPNRTAGWDTKLFAITPDTYRVRLYYGDQSIVTEKIALDEKDPTLPEDGKMYDWPEHYKIVLWPAPLSEFKSVRIPQTQPPRSERPQQAHFQRIF